MLVGACPSLGLSHPAQTLRTHLNAGACVSGTLPARTPLRVQDVAPYGALRGAESHLFFPLPFLPFNHFPFLSFPSLAFPFLPLSPLPIPVLPSPSFLSPLPPLAQAMMAQQGEGGNRPAGGGGGGTSSWSPIARPARSSPTPSPLPPLRQWWATPVSLVSSDRGA